MGCPCTCNASGCSTSSGCNNSGCGCGCDNCRSTQICEPEVPLSCEALGVADEVTGIVVEDGAFCKKTLANPDEPSLLTYNPSGEIGFQDGSALDPINLSQLQQQSSGTVPNIVAQKVNGDLTGLEPYGGVSDPLFQVLIADKTLGTIYFGQLASAFPSGCGLLYKDCVTGEIVTLTLTPGDIISVDINGNPIVVTPSSVFSTVGASIDGENLVIFRTSNNVIEVDCDFLVVRNLAGDRIQLRGFSETINRTLSGAGGVDTGAIAAQTLYAVWAAYDSVNALDTAFVSLSFTSPTLPTGYDYYRLIGSFSTNSGAGWNDVSTQTGNIWTGTNPAGNIIVGDTGHDIAGGSISINASLAALNLGSAPFVDLLTLVKEFGLLIHVTPGGAADTIAKLHIDVDGMTGSPAVPQCPIFTFMQTERADSTDDIYGMLWIPVPRNATGFRYQLSGTIPAGGAVSVSLAGIKWNFI